MFEDSSISFQDIYNEQSFTLLPQISNTFLDQNLTEIHLHDEENFQHLSMSYMNKTLNFQLLSLTRSSGYTFNNLKVYPIKLSEDQQQIIESKCNNIPVKQLKMIRQNRIQKGIDSQLDDNSQPASPTFAQLSTSITSQIIAKQQSYVAALILEQEIVIISFNLTSNQNKNESSHEINNIRVKKIQFQGIVTQLFLNREREQMICSISSESQQKIILVDQIFENSLIKDITNFQLDSEKIVGEIGVSQEFTLVRIVTRLEKEKRFFIYTYHICFLGSSINEDNSDNIHLKIHFNKRPLNSILNDNNFNNCQTIFSQSSSYLTIQDSSNIEVQDFNNHSVKNIIKEFNTFQKQQQQYKTNSNSCSKSTVNNCNQLTTSSPTKLIYNLDKSTLVIANSSVNQCISFYNLDNPISVLDQINSFGSSEQKSIKKIFVSQNNQKLSTPCSASNLMEMATYLKQSSNSNLKLMIVLLDNDTIKPILIDQEILDQKLPELKFVSSQITNIYNQDDTMSLYDFDPNFNRISKNFDVFKTPDRKASINLIASLDNNKFNSKNCKINHIQFGSAINHANNYHSQELNTNQISSQQFQGFGLHFESQNANSQNDRFFSQESNSSRNFTSYKPAILNARFNNNRTLFNENSNSICIDDISLKQNKNASLKREKENSYLFDKISPSQQKIEEAMNSSYSEEYPIHKCKADDFYPSSPLLSQIKNQSRFRNQNMNMKYKDVSRLTMKTNFDSFNSQMFQRAEVSQEDIIEVKQKNINSDSKDRVTIVIDSQTQDDIENSIISQQPKMFTNDDIHRSTASKLSSYISSSQFSKFERNIEKSNSNKCHIIDSIGYLKTNEWDNDDITTFPSSDIFLNQLDNEELENINFKRNSQKRNNNIFNKNNGLQTSQFGKKNNQQNSQQNYRASTSFLTASPTALTSESNNIDFLSKNSQKHKIQLSLSSPQSYQQKISPFNVYQQNKKQQTQEENQLIQTNQQLYYHNKFKLNSNLRQQQLFESSKEIQTLLGKRRLPQQLKQSSSQINIEPIKMIHKSD